MTSRETEVAQLIAEGKSNREIGRRLVISERTVENHVASILQKLGVSARTQIAAHIARTASPVKTAPS